MGARCAHAHTQPHSITWQHSDPDPDPVVDGNRPALHCYDTPQRNADGSPSDPHPDHACHRHTDNCPHPDGKPNPISPVKITPTDDLFALIQTTPT